MKIDLLNLVYDSLTYSQQRKQINILSVQQEEEEKKLNPDFIFVYSWICVS